MEKLSLNQKEIGEVNKFKKMYVSFFNIFSLYIFSRSTSTAIIIF